MADVAASRVVLNSCKTVGRRVPRGSVMYVGTEAGWRTSCWRTPQASRRQSSGISMRSVLPEPMNSLAYDLSEANRVTVQRESTVWRHPVENVRRGPACGDALIARAHRTTHHVAVSGRRMMVMIHRGESEGGKQRQWLGCIHGRKERGSPKHTLVLTTQMTAFLTHDTVHPAALPNGHSPRCRGRGWKLTCAIAQRSREGGDACDSTSNSTPIAERQALTPPNAIELSAISSQGQ
ncbi:hypothetical protein C8T65DRAFT_223259 [Cerioporus squamosus]|nr:hypothetical protein C8T65DRAFT_223259 [Cerioporus squamosus]